MSELLLLVLAILGRPRGPVVLFEAPGFVVERPVKLCRIADPWPCPGDPLLLVNGHPVYAPADGDGVRPGVTR